MHHGTCVRHVPWYMPGSLTSSFLWSQCMVGKTFPAFPVHVQPAILRIYYEAHGSEVRKFMNILAIHLDKGTHELEHWVTIGLDNSLFLVWYQAIIQTKVDFQLLEKNIFNGYSAAVLFIPSRYPSQSSHVPGGHHHDPGGVQKHLWALKSKSS